MLHAFERANIVIQKILQVILGIMCVALLIINIAQIIGRYVFFYSLPWSEEISTYLFIWVIFLGMHLLIQENAELRIDILTFKNNENRQLILDLIREVLSLITITIFFVASLFLMQNAILFPQRAASFQVNTYWIYSVMPIGYILMVFQKITNMMQKGVRLKNGKSTNPQQKEEVL